MHELLVVIITIFINYSLVGLLVVRMLIIFLWFFIKFIFIEIKFTGARQYAWVQTKLLMSAHQRLNVEHPGWNHNHSNFVNKSKLYESRDNFHQWLVGFTDGDGSFTIARIAPGKWTLFFKITQSTYNLRALYFIKKQLGIGSVYVGTEGNKGDFRIRDRKPIGAVLLPIFDKYPLLTSKYFAYLKFRKAYDILENPKLSTEEKDCLLLKLQSLPVPANYMSPAWEVINYNVKSTLGATLVLSKYWLVGFTEAEGSFYLVSKSSTRIVHAFEITQKLDLIVLQAIAHILGITVTNKRTYNTVVTTNSRAISNIISYYSNTMKGIKAVEFRIWARSYEKHKGQFAELDRIRKSVRVFREIRLNKDFKRIDLNKSNK